MKETIYLILMDETSDNAAKRWVNSFIAGLITLNVFAVVLESVDEIGKQWGDAFHIFEIVSVLIFSAEYVLRLWVCTLDKRYAGPVNGRLRFAFTPMALVDLIAVLPFYLFFFLPGDLRFIRMLRLFRLVRVLKLARYTDSFWFIQTVLHEKKEELTFSAFAGCVLLLIAACLMFMFEREAQPEAFSSIPAALWWGVATLTTVGYGDVYPITVMGKALASIVAFLGIGLFAIPAGILASGFSEEIQKRKLKRKACPHCGLNID